MVAIREPSKLMLGPPCDPLTFAVRSSWGNAVLSLGSVWNGPLIVAEKFPDCCPSAEPLTLMSSLPLVIFVGLLKVWSRTCCGSSLLLLLPPPQPATAAGIGSAIARTATVVRMRVKWKSPWSRTSVSAPGYRKGLKGSAFEARPAGSLSRSWRRPGSSCTRARAASGKTSVAAATARRCAAAGLRTVVLSTDPAHSLADSLGAPLAGEPTPVCERLWGQEVQAQREMEVHWGAVQKWLGQVLADRGVMDVAAEELTVPPGMDELFSLLQIKRHHQSGEFDAVIVDCAPTGETLRLLSFPEIARWWLEKVFPWERRMVAAARPWARTLLDLELPSQEVFADVHRLVDNLIAMNEILRDRALATIRLVMNPDRMVIVEAQRTFTYLNLYGYLTDAVIVNRVFPDDVDGYFGGWRERQQEHLRLVDDGFAPVPVLTARYFEEEVIGERMLDRLAGELFAEHRPEDRPPYRAGPRRGQRERPDRPAPAHAVRGARRREPEEGRP